MKFVELTAINGCRIAIPVEKVTGFTECKNCCSGETFVATGADDPEGGENGWYVAEKYNTVKEILKAV